MSLIEEAMSMTVILSMRKSELYGHIMVRGTVAGSAAVSFKGEFFKAGRGPRENDPAVQETQTTTENGTPDI